MTYIENIFLCMVSPLLVAALCMGRRHLRFFLFCIVGMGVCLLSAYVNTFVAALYQTTAFHATVEIAPVVEEVMKLLPLMFYLFVFEPKPDEIKNAVLTLAAGFATFENVCYLTENGAADFDLLLIRGISTGALHIFCGIFIGFGLAYIFRQRAIAITGMVGLLGACGVFHAIFNLLISADGIWRWMGYLFPSGMIIVLVSGWHLMVKLNHMK